MTILQKPTFLTDRKIFTALFAGGFITCTRGIVQAPTYGWTHPISLMGIGFGGLALLLGGMAWFRVRFGFLKSDRHYIYALLAIIGIKILLAALYPSLR